MKDTDGFRESLDYYFHLVINKYLNYNIVSICQIVKP